MTRSGFQRYSTPDSVSSGRAEVILGRRSSTESFPPLGYALSNYDELFEEKVNLFAELLREKPGIPPDRNNDQQPTLGIPRALR
jgi:hypothetical protein